MMSPAVTVPVVPANISLVSADGSGGNNFVVINKDGTINSPTNPASRGDTVVIYASYAEPFANGVTGTDGLTTITAPYPAPFGSYSVTMGGVPATSIPYFGNVPTLLQSVFQINVTIPAGVEPRAGGPAGRLGRRRDDGALDVHRRPVAFSVAVGRRVAASF
jgi:uncharacterized protein (TIGR03437 family)